MKRVTALVRVVIFKAEICYSPRISGISKNLFHRPNKMVKKKKTKIAFFQCDLPTDIIIK